MNNKKKTFREVIDANGGNAAEFVVKLADFTGKEEDAELTLTASCWTDDAAIMDQPAIFSIDASWQRDGGIGQYDNLHGELDGAICALANLISAKFGGEWFYSPSDCAFLQ